MAERGEGGKVTPLASADPFRAAMASGIQTGTGSDWFGPLNPQTPSAPKEVAGRQLDFPSGYNLAIQPRAYETTKFADLRALADNYDLMRIVIEARKDQMAKLNWSIVKKQVKGRRPKIEDDPRIEAVEQFFAMPDRVNFWDEWLRMLLEDLFVLDAPTCFIRRTRGGKLYGLEPIDGATIKRVIDDYGRTPVPPLPAYQQVLKGLPAVDYTTREIIYRPRNNRTHKVYGFSPVEQVLMTVNIALRRQIYTLQYYTEGNIPEALIGVPDAWTPDQIKQFQGFWDELLAGNTAARRHAKFVPGGVGKTFIPTKDAELKGVFDEWLARVVCYAFSVSPLPFVNMLNRSTSSDAQDTATAEGLESTKSWVKQLIDYVIMTEFGAFDLEFKWVEEDEVDPEKQQRIIKGYVESGLLSINEGRDKMGEEPRPGADELMVMTATGYVPVNPAERPDQTQTETSDIEADQPDQTQETQADA